MLSGRFAYVCLVTSRQRLSLTHNLCGATFRLARPYPGSTGPVQHSLYPPVHLPLQQQQTPARHLATSAGMDDDVRVSLRRLLPTVDMEKTTERQIREMLAQELGTDMAPYKKVIKEAIDTWLVAAAEADDESQQGAAAPQAVGRKRGAPSGGAGGERAAKVARSSADGGPPGGVQLDTQGLKWVSVSTFKGQQRVDIRNFFRDREDNLGPTKKGLSLSQSDWGALQDTVPSVSQALADSNEEFVAELPHNRRVTVSVFGGKLTVGIREYYESDGQMQPGMKGINLSPDQWEALVEAIPDINTQLANGPPPPAAAAAAAAAAGTAGAGGGAAAARQPKAAAASRAGAAKAAGGGAAAAANGGGGAAAAAVEVQLGGKKRAAISMFTGKANVDLREVYEKDGQTLPGKKGIMLKPDQWRALVDAAEAITSALTAHNTRYELDLGNNRRVSISEFKNVWYVGVREFYNLNGSMKPGAKGLNMNREQWQKLVAGMNALTAQL